jgi:hypothetical protein
MEGSPGIGNSKLRIIIPVVKGTTQGENVAGTEGETIALNSRDGERSATKPEKGWKEPMYKCTSMRENWQLSPGPH